MADGRLAVFMGDFIGPARCPAFDRERAFHAQLPEVNGLRPSGWGAGPAARKDRA
jgi:hypothetical protein